MRKYLVLAAAAAVCLGIAAVNAPLQARYGPGYGMMGGYGQGDGYGPGMMYGYGQDGRSYRSGQAYRGKRLCWRQTGADRNTGYYEPCRN
jgi:hypothetical protein